MCPDFNLDATNGTALALRKASSDGRKSTAIRYCKRVEHEREECGLRVELTTGFCQGHESLLRVAERINFAVYDFVYCGIDDVLFHFILGKVPLRVDNDRVPAKCVLVYLVSEFCREAKEGEWLLVLERPVICEYRCTRSRSNYLHCCVRI